MTTVVLVRHGITDDVGRTISGRAAGVQLNAAGRRQIGEAAAAVAGLPIAAVLSSPLERARETAAAIAAAHGLDVEITEGFGEYEFGGWTGRAIADLDRGDEQWARFNSVRSLTPAPSGELMLDVQQRAVRALLAMRDRFPAHTIVVVSHGDVIRAVLMYLMGIPLDFVHRLEVSPARISIVQIDQHGPRVLQVNGDTATAAH